MGFAAEPTGAHIGLYGKHPAFGDFVIAGLSDKARDTLEHWLQHVMPAVRAGWGDNWGAYFDASPVIRFWFGGALMDEVGPLCGIMVPSRDKVGRRFPLIAAVGGADQPAPPLSGDQTLYQTITDAVAGFTRGDGVDANGFAAWLAQTIAPSMPASAEPIEPAFWAARGDGDLLRLWGDVGEVDHMRATAGRSYLWCSGPGGAAVHVTRSLPGPEVLAWLMSGAVAGQPEQSPQPPADPPAPAADADAFQPTGATQSAPMFTTHRADNDKTVPPLAQDSDNNTIRAVPMPRLTD